MLIRCVMIAAKKFLKWWWVGKNPACLIDSLKPISTWGWLKSLHSQLSCSEWPKADWHPVCSNKKNPLYSLYHARMHSSVLDCCLYLIFHWKERLWNACKTARLVIIDARGSSDLIIGIDHLALTPKYKIKKGVASESVKVSTPI